MSALGLGISFHKRRILPASGSKLTYPGLIAAWSAAGKSNDDADRNVLRDLTGNGHDITLNNFAFKGLSGYGGYATNIGSWSIGSSGIVVNKIDNNTITITESIWNPATVAFSWSDTQYTSKKQKFKITGLINGQTITFGSSSDDIIAEATQDGNYEIDWNLIKGTSLMIFTNFISKCNITIESLPEYPDALVFDGVDDYGINEEMPILTDYTIIVKRKRINLTTGWVATKCSARAKWGAFLFETPRVQTSTGDCEIYNFGGANRLFIQSDDVTWQTSTAYNQKKINRGSSLDGTIFTLGVLYSNKNQEFFNGAFYSAYLFDRSLDEQEIKAFIRKYIDADYLLPSEIPTPDCYYDFTNGDNASETRDTIVDLSGNGNDAKAYNFAWNEEGSGYKDGALQFDGVNDYISLEAFDSGFKTIFMVCKPFYLNKILYDQRYLTPNHNFAIYNESGIAYSSRNNNDTFINNKINTKLTSMDLLNKKQLISVKTLTVNNIIPCVGANFTFNSYFSKMSLYKFLGFKEALTEEQIQYVIKKYNLLDGVDEIEVS